MMPTVLPHDHPGVADELQRALETAQTVIFPTDTVYGIGGNPWDERTLARVRSIKQRPAGQPFTLHLATVDAIARYTTIGSRTRALIAQLLPGPYTLLLPASPGAPPSAISAGADGTVGIRVPDHPFFELAMTRLDRPLFGTSVNRHGEPPLNVIDDIIDRFSNVDLIISGPVGLGPSAILDLTVNPARLIRGEIPERVRDLLESS
jgi:L-threonylcarbamoyladenylate synthase